MYLKSGFCRHPAEMLPDQYLLAPTTDSAETLTSLGRCRPRPVASSLEARFHQVACRSREIGCRKLLPGHGALGSLESVEFLGGNGEVHILRVSLRPGGNGYDFTALVQNRSATITRSDHSTFPASRLAISVWEPPQMPAEVIKVPGFLIALPVNNLAVFVSGNRPFGFVYILRPQFALNNRPREPIHAQAVIMQFAEKDIRADGSCLWQASRCSACVSIMTRLRIRSNAACLSPRSQRSLVAFLLWSMMASKAFCQVRVETPESVPARYALAIRRLSCGCRAA